MGRSSRLALGAIAAAVAAGQVAPSHLGAAIALTLAAVLLIGETRPRWGAATLLPIVAGAGLIAIRLATVQSGSTTLGAPPEGSGPWSLVVESVGSARDGQQTATLGTRPGADPPFQVAATLPRYPVVVPGDRVIVDGSIRPRPDSPYGVYLEQIGAVGTLLSRRLEVEPAPDDPGRRLEGLRRGAADALAQVLPEPEAGLASGILIGLRDLVDRDLASAFTTAGVSHVVAISGWNIAIVAAAIAAMTGRLGRRRRSVVTILAIVGYVAFSGASASVVRAALMAGVVLLARETGRAGRAAAALGWAATILLIADPHLIGDAGFQLSSLATAGLIAWATPLTAWLEGLGGGRLPHWLAESLGVSLAAQAATLPIILVSFGRLAVLSPLVNLLVVPLVAPAMAAGVVALCGGALVLAGLPTAVGAILAAPGWVILGILVEIVEVAAALPLASVTLRPPLDLGVAGVVAAGLVWATWWRGRRRRGDPRLRTEDMAPATEGPSSGGGSTARHRGTAPGRAASRAAIAALVVAIAVTGGVVAARPAGIARISILDVGQGDAILVEGSKGGRLLIDGGPDPGRLLVVLDRRVPPWDRRIDALILTHPHEDHVAGLALLLERYHVGRVFEPGMIGPGPGYAAWQRTLAAIGSAARATLAAGDRLAVDEIAFKVLWPIRGQVPTTPPDGGTGINNVSVVLLGQIGERRVLLMGDVEEGIDPSLLKDDLPHVDLLKVAHHGSKTATTQAFVDAVRPTVAVASAGTRNPYGHPAQSTLDRLAASGARVLRTDLDGTVVVGFEPGGMTVRAEGGRPSADVRRQPPTAVSAVASKAPAVASRASTFLCAVPVAGLVAPTRQPAAASSADDRRAAAPDAGRGRTVGYHRADDGAWAGGGRLPPALPRSTLLGRAGRPCHRRPDRRIDRPARRSSDARCSTRPCVGFDPAGRGAPPAEPLQRSSRPPPALG